jgi:hypothetical protein
VQFKKKLSRRDSIIVLAILTFAGIGGVTAAATITVSDNNPLNLGAGASAATACDNSVDIAGVRTGSSLADYRYTAFTISNLDLSATGCGGQIMQLIIRNEANATLQLATWSLPTRLDYSTISFRFGTTSLGLLTGNTTAGTYVATTALASIAMENLKGFALGISRNLN